MLLSKEAAVWHVRAEIFIT